MDTLCAAYWKPVYKYVRLRWNPSSEDAQDLTQGFFAQVIERGLLDKYDPAKGRLRTFLRMCVDSFVINDEKAAKRLKRGGNASHVALDFAGAEEEMGGAALDPPRFLLRNHSMNFSKKSGCAVSSSWPSRICESIATPAREKERFASSRNTTSQTTKPMLGLALGSTLGLLDGLSGFLEPSLAPVMSSVMTFSLLNGLAAGVAIGYVSKRVHSMIVGILAGIAIAAGLSLLVILHAGMALFWDIMLPGMLLGVIVGFTTQKFGNRAPGPLAR